MENLNHLYFFEKYESQGVRSRYTIGQILYDIVTVPEQIRQACEIIKNFGAPRNFKPGFYTLKHIHRVQEQLPYLKFDDAVFVSNRIGYALSATMNKHPVVSVEIIHEPKGKEIKEQKSTTLRRVEHITNTKTNQTFTIITNHLPNYDEQERDENDRRT